MFEDPSLQGLGFLLKHYFDARVMEARQGLRDDFVAQAAQLEQLTQKQRALEAQANTLGKAQKVIAQRASAERERERRLNSQQFARWLDNASWAVRVFYRDSRVLVWLVAVHWLLVIPVTCGLTVRFVVSDTCLKLPMCRSVIGWIIR